MTLPFKPETLEDLQISQADNSLDNPTQVLLQFAGFGKNGIPHFRETIVPTDQLSEELLDLLRRAEGK